MIVYMLFLLAILYGLLWAIKYSMKQEAQKQERLMKYKDLMPGDYLFPVEKFYELCVKDGWNNINNDIHIRKMILIAKNIIKADGKADEKDFPNIYNAYASAEQVKKFFTTVKLQKQNEKDKRKRELEEKESHPQKVVLDYYGYENLFRSFNERCKSLRYLDKRREYLKYLISYTENKVKSAEYEYKKAKRNASSAYHATKGKDWAIAGGIANAIAGPAAGIMVASQTIAENEANKDFNNLIWNAALDKQLDAAGKLADVEKILENYEKDLESLDTKIVFEEIPSKELFESLSISADINKEKNNVLEVSFKSAYPKRKDLATVIDGSVQVRVLCDNKILEEVCVALPCYGVQNNNKYETARTFLQYKMIPGKVNYSFEIKPNFLWLMEK